MLLFEVARSLARCFHPAEENPGRVGAAAALVGILCPFAAFHQRIALAESLFRCETLLAVHLALRLASEDGAVRWPRVSVGISFGTVMGAAMLTRQNFSYALWALPFCAWFAPSGPVSFSNVCSFPPPIVPTERQ